MQHLTVLLCWVQEYPSWGAQWAGRAVAWARGHAVSVGLWAAVASGAGLRVLLVSAGRAPFNADEAVVGLMARHILQGERPVFFYGQSYLGSLDAYLAAGGFLFFGQQVWVLRLVQILLYVITILSAAKVAELAFGSQAHGLLAAWLLAIPPVNAVLYTTVTLGGYGEMLLLGSLELLAALRIASSFFKHMTPSWTAWFSLGLLAGLGVWVFGLTLVFTLPVLLYLAWRWWLWSKSTAWQQKDQSSRRIAIRQTVLGAVLVGVGAGMGAAPWWVYALKNSLHRLMSELGGTAIAGVEGLTYLQEVGRHFASLLLLGLPAALGMRPPWEVRWLALPLLPLALAFWLGVLGLMVRAMWGQGRRAIQQTGEPASRMDLGGERLLAWVGLTLVAGFVFTPFGADPSGRYFLPLLIPLAAFGAYACLQMRRSWGRLSWGVAGLILAFNAWGILDSALRFPPGLTTQFDAAARIDQQDQTRLASFLLENGERRGYTTYWVTYPLAFHSGEQLIFTPRLPYHPDFRYTDRDDRYPPYSQAVADADRIAYITARQPWLDERLRAGFNEQGIAWRETQIGDFRVFYQLERVVRPEQLNLERSQ
ncbi:MAG TPA: glycosyltransferase family 39 protein [Anaerolineales bacterium]|nr:glycosyltransferase family 39 protein [Anaerolineales bacterium]